MAKYKYGVDLGTTNSSISLVMEDELTGLREPVCFPVDKQSISSSSKPEEIIRSVVGFDEEGNAFVGDEAFLQIKKGNIENPIQNFKLRMLSSEDDSEVVEGKKYSDVVAAIFGRLFREADKRNGGIKIDGVVVGLPVPDESFELSNATKSIYLTALVKCGFYKSLTEAREKTDFRPEPIAVALFFGNKTALQNKWVIVCDFGGGTMDLALVKLNVQNLSGIGRQQPHEVKAKNGSYYAGNQLTKLFFVRGFLNVYADRHFKGNRDKVYEIFKSSTLESYPGNNGLSVMTFWDNILHSSSCGNEFVDAVDKLKISLCEHSEDGTPITFEFVSSDGSLRFEPTQFVYEDFRKSIDNNKNRDLYSNVLLIREMVDDYCKKDPSFSINKVDKILLAGGSSLVPVFKDMIEKEYGRDRVVMAENKLETLTCTSKGLAVEGYCENGYSHIEDITDCNYGYLDDSNGKTCVVIPKGTKYKDARFPGLFANYKFKIDITQIDQSCQGFKFTIRKNESDIATIHFDGKNSDYGGSYRLYFCIDSGTQTLFIRVYDLVNSRFIDDDVPESVRSYRLKD